MTVSEKILQIFGNRKNCNRILLINPLSINEERLNITIAKNKRYYAYPPYGLGILCTNLKAREYAVELLDLNIETLSFVNNVEERPNMPELISKAWKDKLRKTIVDFMPDVVGISCPFTMTHEMMVKTAEFIKSFSKELPVVAGGVHVSNAPEIVLREGKDIDFVSMYEGDHSFCDMLDFVNGKTTIDKLTQIGTLIEDNFVCISERNIPDSEDINIIPDYLDLPIEKYNSFGEIGAFRFWRSKDTRGSTVISNRGCRGRCAFCSVHHLTGGGVRSRSIQSVVDEIEKLKYKYNINHIVWLDDDLFFDSKRAIQLFREITKRNLNITWDASNGIIVSSVANCPELIDVAVESGCIGMFFGIESGNPEIIRRMHKPSSVKHCLKVAEIMKKYPQIFTRGFLIIGFPKETLGQIYDTVNLALEMSLDWYIVSLLTPLPSTELYDSMIQEELITGAGSASDKKLGSLLGFVGYGYNVRHGERRRLIEEKRQINSKNFLLNESIDKIPSREELNDLWLGVDYKVNYEKILNQNDSISLRKMQKFLEYVSDRMTIHHPLSNLFLGIVESRLGDLEDAQKRMSLSRKYLSNSTYWQEFFKALNLENLYKCIN